MLTETSIRFGSSALEHVSRHFHEHQLVDPSESIAALIHDSAEMILLSNHLRPLRGRQEIMASLRKRDRESELYSGTVETFEWLDETTVLVCGQARYVTQAGGCTVSRVWWVDQFRDNLLWRAHAFTNESDARAWGAARLIESDVERIPNIP
jgi:ketosteroid isomerase-like protein